MFKLETARYLLVETPLHVIRQRLERDTFETSVPVGDDTLSVTFPADWPGDALVIFPIMAEGLEQAPGSAPPGGTIICRSNRVAVGQIGAKGPPDAAGAVEIGYGVNPSHQGQGCATEVVSAFVGWLLEQPEVNRVTAECLVTNAASIRVLEKTGFLRMGRRHDEEEGGTLVMWERT